MAPDKIVKMGMCHVPEGRKIFPALSVYENLIAGSLGNPKLSKNRIQELLEEQYKLFPRLKERLTQAGGSLSGGEQQRVAVARAMVNRPPLLICDEPTGNLDSKNGREVMELLSELNREGTTVIMVTHSQHDSTYAHRVLHLFDGELVKDLANKL